MTDSIKRTLQFIRIKTVRNKTGLSTASIYNKLKADSKYYDPDFPQQIKVGGGVVVWIEHEIDDWMSLQIKRSRDAVK